MAEIKVIWETLRNEVIKQKEVYDSYLKIAQFISEHERHKLNININIKKDQVELKKLMKEVINNGKHS